MTDTPSTTPVLTRDGGRATIRLARPAVHNRIEPADVEALAAIVAALDADPELRVVVVTGTGDSFSSGFHIGALAEGKRDDLPTEPGNNAFANMVDAVERLRVPTIAALNGGVYGGATDLALACDFRIGVEGMRFRMPAARLGVHYYPSGMTRYVTRLGLAAAKRLFFLAETVEADELLALGFLDRLVPRGALAGAVDALADALAANAPLALQGMKRALNEIAAGRLDRAATAEAMRRAARSADAKEGVAAWAGKRPPRFTGT